MSCILSAFHQFIKSYGRFATVLPDDIFICSYPKSGNTWAKFLLANLRYPDEKITFANLEKKIPAIYDYKCHPERADRPRLVKSHEAFEPRYRRVIYLVRDPRDVVVSLYHYAVKRRVIDETYPLPRYADEFLSGNVNRNNFGSWGEHVGSWLGARRDGSDFLLLRYEDMLEDPLRALTSMAEFAGLESTPERIQAAVQASAFDTLQSLEDTQSRNPMIGGALLGRRDRRFMRRGVAGGWRDELPADNAQRICEHWHGYINELGYDTTP
jgi:hypothetical protein